MDSNIEANADKVLIMVLSVKAAAFLKTPNFTHQILLRITYYLVILFCKPVKAEMTSMAMEFWVMGSLWQPQRLRSMYTFLMLGSLDSTLIDYMLLLLGSWGVILSSLLVMSQVKKIIKNRKVDFICQCITAVCKMI